MKKTLIFVLMGLSVGYLAGEWFPQDWLFPFALILTASGYFMLGILLERRGMTGWVDAILNKLFG